MQYDQVALWLLNMHIMSLSTFEQNKCKQHTFKSREKRSETMRNKEARLTFANDLLLKVGDLDTEVI